MSPMDREPISPSFSHWPWHGWVDDSFTLVLPQLFEKEVLASPLKVSHKSEDEEWESLVVRLF
jgi:hypothetical protein